MPTDPDAGALTSVNGSRAEHGTGLEEWLGMPQDPPALPAAQLPDDFDTSELDDDRRQAALNRERAVLQRDPSRLAVLSPKELSTERKQVEHIRNRRRRVIEKHQIADVDSQERELRDDARIARVTGRQRVWRGRATARLERLTDPTDRMAATYRTEVVVSFLLRAFAFVGIGWCAWSVGQSLDGGVIGYLVEPLFSLPLLIIMTMHSIAAQNGRVFPSEEHKTHVFVLEIVLLAITTGLQVAPVVPGTGRWVDTTTLITHLLAPSLIVLMVVLQPIIAAFLGSVLVGLYRDATRRLDTEQMQALKSARRLNDLWAAGRIRSANPDDANDRSWGPSVSSVAKELGVGKQACQAAVAAWRVAYAPSEK